MNLILIFSILFFGGACYNVINRNYSEAIGGIIFTAISFGLYWHFRGEKKRAEEFAEWIIINKDQVSNNSLDYNGYPIDKETELVQYQACISFLLFTVKVSSRFYVKGSLSSSIAKILYTLATLLLGWWGIPWGPIYTIQVIIKNITGGNKVKVENMIN
ncbi:MAG: hypothetical protein ACYCYE_04600 [Clostridia bacterium]